MNVYEMQQEFERVLELLDTIEQMKAAGEDGLEQFEADTLNYFDNLTGTLQEKMDNISKLICNLETEKAGKKAEIDRMNTRVKAIDNKIDYLKNSLMKPTIKASGLPKIEGQLFTVSLRKSEAVEIVDETAIPEIYIKTKVTTSPDKTLIKKRLKAGEEISGVKLKENQSVQIK